MTGKRQAPMSDAGLASKENVAPGTSSSNAPDNQKVRPDAILIEMVVVLDSLVALVVLGHLKPFFWPIRICSSLSKHFAKMCF